MEEKNWLDLMGKHILAEKLMDTNSYTERYGLCLTEEDAEMLAVSRQQVLMAQRRVEFGESILPKLIFAFCDSGYVEQENFVSTLQRLQEIFFLYKNEMEDEITDEELINFMREQFETVCFGDLDYLEGTCLELFAEAVRAGYRGFCADDGKGEFSGFDIVKRWDRDLYLAALQDLF